MASDRAQMPLHCHGRLIRHQDQQSNLTASASTQYTIFASLLSCSLVGVCHEILDHSCGVEEREMFKRLKTEFATRTLLDMV
jgi:hypothetical protein